MQAYQGRKQRQNLGALTSSAEPQRRPHQLGEEHQPAQPLGEEHRPAQPLQVGEEPGQARTGEEPQPGSKRRLRGQCVDCKDLVDQVAEQAQEVEQV